MTHRGLLAIIAGWLVVASIACAAPPTESAGEPVSIGQRFKIESAALGETRTYVVHKPRDYDFSSDAYPLVILTDGDANIHHVTATTDFLANAGRAQPMLVVGIDNTDRQRDLTPPFLSSPRERGPEGEIGGAQKFLSFIADELIPHIDRSYRTRPTRILIGHSYGGLFAVYTLFNRPEVFKAYIAVSPSLWWDDQALAKQADQFVADHKQLRFAMFMTMGNEGGTMLGGAQKVIGSLGSSPRNIGAMFHQWPEESHSSVVMRSVYEGMEWLHEIYYIHDPARTYEEAGLQPFDKRFAFISEYLGYEVKIPAPLLMDLQHELSLHERFADAQKVLQRVLELYPNNATAHYDLGRSYLKTNQTQLAAEELQRTLQLFPGNMDARAELEKLGRDPKSLVVDANPSAAALRSYVGEYHYSDEVLHVSVKDGRLFLKSRDDARELRARSSTDFYAIGADREYTFNRQSGRIESVTVRLQDFEYRSRKVK